jgi:hypothetical protein
MGAEATFLEPNVDRARFLVSPRNDIGGTPLLLSDFTYGSDVDYFNVAPRVWLGYRDPSGLGVQMRYWQSTYANDVVDDRFDPPFLDNAFAADTRSSLEMYTFDLEGTFDFCTPSCDMMLTFGARHASFEQHDSVTSVTRIDNLILDFFDLYTQRAAALRDFDGTGLTFSWAGSTPVDRTRKSSIFWNLRGSTLWGQNKAAAATTVMGNYFIVDPDTALVEFGVDDDLSETDETLFIGEVQLGVRWSCMVRSLNAQMFAQVAAEYQYWNAGGGNAIALESLRNIENSELVSSVRTGDLETSLVGFALSTGFVW